MKTHGKCGQSDIIHCCGSNRFDPAWCYEFSAKLCIPTDTSSTELLSTYDGALDDAGRPEL